MVLLSQIQVKVTNGLKMQSFLWKKFCWIWPISFDMHEELNFPAFVACDILIYVEIEKEQHTRPEEHDDSRSVPQLKPRMLLSEAPQKSLWLTQICVSTVP